MKKLGVVQFCMSWCFSFLFSQLFFSVFYKLEMAGTVAASSSSSSSPRATASQTSQSSAKTTVGATTPVLKERRRLSVYEGMFCGGVAGVVSRVIVAPLDVIKIRFQVKPPMEY